MQILAIIFPLYLYTFSLIVLPPKGANDLCAAIEKGPLLQSL